MTRSNVMVSYAPASWAAAAPVPRRDSRAGLGRKAVWAGVLLAGTATVALFPLGAPERQPDEGPRMGRVAVGQGDDAGDARPWMASDVLPAPVPIAADILPFLAFVSDGAIQPLPAVAQPAAPPPAVAPPALTKPPLRHPSMGAPQPPRASATTRLHAAAANPPQAERVPLAGGRRDLEGFLADRGLLVAGPPPGEPRSRPVADWTAGELAAAPAPIAPSAPATLLADAPPGGEAAAPAVATPPAQLVLPQAEVPVPSGEAPAFDPPPPGVIEPEAALAAPPLPDPATAEPVASRGDPAPAAPALALSGSSRADLRVDQDRRPASPPDAAPRAEPPASASAARSGATAVDAPQTASFVQSYPLAVVDGEALGAVTLRDLGPQGQAIHLGALIGVLKLRMPGAAAEFAGIGAAADRFVTLDQLRAAGITIQFDPRAGRLLIDAR
ncbi:MAG: hypothetical protein JNJ92_01170 [Altererythrobacter sp.]|nr:hypothetical protein [Altererythrobacter sp.]